MFKVEPGRQMNLAVFELFPCFYLQTKMRLKEWKRQVNKVQTEDQTIWAVDGQRSWMFKMLVTSWNFWVVQGRDNSLHVICLENWYTLRFFK